MSLGKLSYGIADTFGSYLLGHSNITNSIAKQFKPSASWKKLTDTLNLVENSKGRVTIQGDKLTELFPKGLKHLLDNSQNPVANISYRAGAKSKYNFEYLTGNVGAQVKLKWGRTWDKINIHDFINDAIHMKHQKVYDILHNSSQSLIDNIRTFLGK